MKKCSRCGEDKPLKEYWLNRANKPNPYRLTYCNTCRYKQNNANLNSSVDKFLSDRYNRLVLRARNKNIQLTITKEEFIELYHSQNGKCFYTDINMVCRVGDGGNRYSMSIDKIIPELGYTKNNTVLCINKANTIKNDCSLEEIREWMPEWYERIISKIND